MGRTKRGNTLIQGEKPREPLKWGESRLGYRTGEAVQEAMGKVERKEESRAWCHMCVRLILALRMGRQ